MLKSDRALAKLKQPQRLGETIKGLPCDLCNTPHTRVIAVRVNDCLMWEIHSPCLDKIAKMACKIIG